MYFKSLDFRKVMESIYFILSDCPVEHGNILATRLKMIFPLSEASEDYTHVTKEVVKFDWQSDCE
jgi:hypothetical protein